MHIKYNRMDNHLIVSCYSYRSSCLPRSHIYFGKFVGNKIIAAGFSSPSVELYIINDPPSVADLFISGAPMASAACQNSMAMI
jgi:hypothetical protein